MKYSSHGDDGTILNSIPDVVEALLKLDLEEAGHPVLHGRSQVLGAGDPLGPGEVLESQLGNIHELCHAGVQFRPEIHHEFRMD